MAATALAADRPLERALDAGSGVFAVCAGYQILGRSFSGADGRPRPGLGLLDCTTSKSPRRRPVGEILVEPAAEFGLPVLTGYENHAGQTERGPAARPLGSVVAVVGNGDGSEGAVQGRVVGTYLHGPVLARNPALADMLLSWVVGEVKPLDDAEADELRRERIGRARSWWQRRLAARA
jgi:CobQ-like glutamine amidotransferase family enzyme